MEDKILNLILRADDFGSAHSADIAIAECVNKGHTVKNISVMANGKWTEKDADMIRDLKGVDIGMHSVYNSEWDEVKWQPCAPKDKIRSMLNADGEFYASQAETALAGPDPEEVLIELNAQLDKLTRLGLPVSYIDSHMLTEGFIPGMTEVFREWVRSKGLRDIYDYYNYTNGMVPAWGTSYMEYLENVRSFLNGMDRSQQNIYILHPAVASEETYIFANPTVDKGLIMQQRDWEYKLLSEELPKMTDIMEKIRLLRFSEAEKVEGGEYQIRHAFGIE